MLRDGTNKIQVKRSISSQSVADNTAQVGQIIDIQGYEELTYLLNIGSVADADATFTVLLEEGNASNLSDAAAVADADMISQTPGVAPETAAGFQFDDDNEVRKLGYRGSKRYTRLTITPVGNASAAIFGAVALLSRPRFAPVVQATS